MWPWQMALVTTAILWPLGFVVARVGAAGDRRWMERFAPYLTAAGSMIFLYGIWQIALDFLVVHSGGAISRAKAVYRWERAVHLPSEVWFQHQLLKVPWLVRRANDYYADVDFPGLCLAFGWLFWRHRDRFKHYRLTLICSTAICAVIQAIPVAPPRLLPHYGFVDTGILYGQSVYGQDSTSPGVLTTMPSVHVLWATLVAVLVIGASPSRWRWWIVADPVLTVLVVVGTGNHFWADGIVADLILVAVLAAQRWAPRTSLTSLDGTAVRLGSMLGSARRSQDPKGEQWLSQLPSPTIALARSSKSPSRTEASPRTSSASSSPGSGSKTRRS